LSSAPRIRTEITQVLRLPALPIGLERHQSQRRGSNPLCDLGKVACHRKHFADVGPARASQAGCPRADSNRHCRRPRRRASCRLGYEDMGAPDPDRTGASALREQRSAAELQGRSCRTRTRTSIRGFRGRCPAIRRSGNEYGRRESNAHAARFELARSADCHHSRVRREGHDPPQP
jgi:hypothetical protein